mgnify:CR=1 FL=1
MSLKVRYPRAAIRARLRTASQSGASCPATQNSGCSIRSSRNRTSSIRRIYTDEAIFREEQQKVFNKSWIIGCHESELPGAFDYRTFTHPAGTPLIIVRGEDQKVRAFYNVCPHRGNTLLYDPVGNAQAHHLHLSLVVVRHQGQLRRHHA